MRRAFLAVAGTALLGSTPALAQGVTIEELARRVEALERENAALRAQVEQLADRPVPPAPAYPAATPVHATPTPSDARAGREETTADEPWDAAYAGIHAGYARARSSFRSENRAPDVQKDDGYSFGAQLGRRWQSGHVIAGLELEADFARIPNQSVDVFSTGTPILRLDLRARGRVKGQLGVTSGPWLAYGTIGLEQAMFRRGLTPGFAICTPSCVFNPTGPTRFETRHYTGFLLGVGAGYAFADGRSIELEGTRSTFASSSTFLGDFHPRSALGVTLRLNQPIR
ncbi:MAG TPA: outer membrane beta-barrel protein [Allosphingosinicella sp.]